MARLLVLTGALLTATAVRVGIPCHATADCAASCVAAADENGGPGGQVALPAISAGCDDLASPSAVEVPSAPSRDVPAPSVPLLTFAPKTSPPACPV